MAASVDKEAILLIAQIAVAFEDVLRGEGTSLHETRVLDDYGSGDARREAREWDTDTHWRKIPDQDLLDLGNYLCYLDGLGWRYYLPAYMIHSLKIFSQPRTDYADTRDHTLDVLTYFEQSDFDKWEIMYQRLNRPARPRPIRHYELGDPERQKWKILTTEQAQSVCCYLRYVAAHGDDRHQVRRAEKGLRQHWGRFCGSDQESVE